MEAPRTWGGENHPWGWTADLSSSIPGPSSTPWENAGDGPTRAQHSAKFPLVDSKAENPAGCWHSPDTQSPCSSSSKSLSWEALGRASVTAEPSRSHTEMGRALFAPAEPSPGAPQHLLSCTQTTPTPPAPARSPAGMPQNQPGFVIREGFTQVFPFFHTLKSELHQLLLQRPNQHAPAQQLPLFILAKATPSC